MKFHSTKQLEALKRDAFREGIKHTIRELLGENLVLFNPKVDQGSAMKLFVDPDNHDEFDLAVKTIYQRSYPHMQTSEDIDTDYLRLTRSL